MKVLAQNVSLKQMDSVVLSGKYGEIHSILIWKEGEMLFEKYYNGWHKDSVHQLQSATKSVIGTLLGIALQNGFVKDVNDKIGDYIENVPEDKKNISIKDLLTQRHGLDWNEGAWEDPKNDWRRVIESEGDWYSKILSVPMDTLPGNKFLYSNAAPTIVSLIIQRSSKLPIDSFAKRFLFEPLAIKKYGFWQGNGGPANNGMALISLNSTDLLKIGRLYLQNGEWKKKQIIPKEFAQEATSGIVKGVGENGVFWHYDYGYFWWSNPVYRLNKSATESTIVLARGAGGQNLIIDKKRKLVMVITAWNLARSNWPQAIYHDFVEGMF